MSKRLPAHRELMAEGRGQKLKPRRTLGTAGGGDQHDRESRILWFLFLPLLRTPRSVLGVYMYLNTWNVVRVIVLMFLLVLISDSSGFLNFSVQLY